MLLSDVCLSVAYIRPNSRTERPIVRLKFKIDTELPHVTRESDTTLLLHVLKANMPEQVPPGE